MSDLKLFLFGSPRIERDNEPIRMNERKVTGLIAYLAVTGTSHTRDALATLFWPNSDQVLARTALRQTLSVLKKTIGEEWLEIERESLALKRQTGFWLDVDHFSRQLTVCQTHGHPADRVCLACLTPLTEAVELYRNDFLTGLTLRDSPGFDEWQLFQTENLRCELASALQRLVYYHSTQEEYELAITYARRWLTLDPLHELAHYHLMQLYVQTGRRTAALHQYRECARILKKELGVTPQEEITQLYRTIQQNRTLVSSVYHIPGSLSIRLHNLPQQLTRFIGREEELAEIDQLLKDPDCRLLTLIGPGGIGKTRLALQAAARQIAFFSHGAHFISLAALSSADLFVTTIADSLKVARYSQQTPKVQLINYLREKEMLLVMDNFEHLLKEAGLLVEILQNAPKVKVLLTSRERLNLRGEWLFDIQGLRFPEGEETDGIEDYSAVQLFVQSARRVSRGSCLLKKEKRFLARICQLVEGVPLAIELAAAWIRLLSCAEIAREIERNLDFLTTSMRDMPERQRSLRATFNHSWNLLSEEEKEAFTKLSVFQGGFQRGAAEQVANVPLLLLLSLADKALLHKAPSGRYEILEILRQYAAEKLAQAPEEENITRDLHCQFFAGFLHQWNPLFDQNQQAQALQAIDAEIENVRLAWQWMVEHAKTNHIEQCLESLYCFHQMRSWFQEGEETFAKAARELRKLGNPSKETNNVVWRLLARQAGFLTRLGHYGEAKELLQDSLTFFLASADKYETVFCLNGLAIIASYQGEYAKGRELLKEALTQAQTAQTLNSVETLYHLEADSLQLLGNVSRDQSDFAEARVYYEQALHIYHKLGGQRGIKSTLTNLSYISWCQENYAEANSYSEQALRISRMLDDKYDEGWALNHLGLTAMSQGNFAKAKTYYERALSVFHQVGHRSGKIQALGNLGNISAYLGDYSVAKTYLEQSLLASRETNNRRVESTALCNLGLLSHHLSNDKAAQEYSEQALLIAQELGDRLAQGYALTYLGHALVGLEHLAEAVTAYEQALALRQELDQPHMAIESRAGLARAYLAQGDLAKARVQVEEILNYLRDKALVFPDEPFQVYLTCYHVLRANQDTRAHAVLNTAHSLLQERAAKISDEELRRSFLENVAVHREILGEFALCTTMQPDFPDSARHDKLE